MARGKWKWSATVSAVLGIAIVTGSCDLESRSYMSIGTAGTAGIYYPLGGAIANRLTALDEEGRQFTAEVTGGSVQNINLLQRGEMDLAMSVSITPYQVYHGIGGSEPMEDLRIVAPLWPNLTNVLVPRGSSAEHLGDLRGRRISVGPAGSGNEQLSRALLEVYGLTYDDIQARYLTYGESAAALRDRSIEGAIIGVGYPAAAVMEVLETGEGRLLPIASPWADSLIVRHPYYFLSAIPAGAYRGVDQDIATVAEWNWVLARADFDDDIVRNLLHILTEERDRLERINPMATQIDIDVLRQAPIPLHAATEVWLQELRP